jgi:threonine dehydratase
MTKNIKENKLTGQTMVAVTSGANMDFGRLRFVAERADASEKTLAVAIPEEPGSMRALYTLFWP